MINCIIIDDEQHAIEVTRSFCKNTSYLNVIGEFTDPLHAISFIDDYKDKIDLVFLDIEMPRFSGIDFLKKYTFPNVILVTAFQNYALEAFEYGVIDYLLKPFSFERFSTAVERVYSKVQKKEEDLAKQDTNNAYPIFFYIKTERNKYIKVYCEEVKYIEGAKNFTVIYTDTKKIITTLSLKDLEEQLPAQRFVRIHKSVIINVDHLDRIEGNNIILKALEKPFLLGSSYKRDFIKTLKDNILK